MHNTLPLRRRPGGLRRLLARAAWWGLPWLVLLTISASAAYGMTVATAGTEAVGGRDEMATTPIDGPVSTGGCDAMSARMLQNAVANGWVPDRSAGYCNSTPAGEH
jgi:hypothetical protein